MTTQQVADAPVNPDTVSEPAETDLVPDKAVTLVQRVLMPRPADPLKVRSLYLDEENAPIRVRQDGRHSGLIAAGSEVSFATYFNAFPASYWRRWSVLGSVVLRVTVSGTCRVDVHRSKADGESMHVTGVSHQGDEQTIELELDLAPFIDGGWYWFDVTAESDTVVREAGWYAPQAPAEEPRLAVGICTYNRPVDALAAARALADDPAVLERLALVTIADQGNNHVRDAAGYTEVKAALGDRLRVVEQPNLGGSGGFARTIHEAFTRSDATHVVLLDDDIMIEPDSLLRARAFAAYAKNPILVGGQMLALQNRSVLHSMGEIVDRETFFWTNAPNTEYHHDFGKESLRESPDLHRRIDVDYNGWWMCLIPRTVVDAIGMPLPVFIKWDDAEYGLRAFAAGFPTASLPGTAIWHLSWGDKDDASDWQAYYHIRNRLVAAALHSPHRHGGKLFREMLKADLRFLINLQYSTVELHHLAYRDFLAGPESLFRDMPQSVVRAREVRATHADGQVLPSSSDLPLPSMPTAKAVRFRRIPVNPLSIGKTLVSALVHNARPVAPENLDTPQLNLAFQDARWFLLSRLDSATVGTADGRGVTFRRRDPATFRRLVTTSAQLLRRMSQEFPDLQRRYQAAAGELTSMDRWGEAFEEWGYQRV
ncbi:galactofuranosylgalactofuranosylrhamnosyl-N-acetylglucosaminyl-diphospho-decaprenol beta-1,5/1,6-galactofuranosyltransferase [Geodermatophilus dictyosporus]|uniref:Galactofuranosylgalactofuranosylrhamnosyl-N-acetylglucosaminyl-diphospho-decaprenol beta-1,5/1,6-galactofuranosyltransferase n=1 Tax=Geodermatophilus dictyosporus TaxID=1523247 RepID=A0A1I5L9H9_9ACTN|nr:glycosyltransferase [Geodermatophilus dictyosporus]SFO94019.1 galactofuranosylgalactofuranosylrhamnosyl-N-acetylglucosaminyl-diphospho-decaprenol beta-1,5/1,6-galactofuranosyltransferase [Geodermatophilus dictyosporus]